jgi:hypothetical protein
MKSPVRSFAGVAAVLVVVGGGVLAACDSSLDIDVSGILSGQSGASCSNTTPDAGGDAGGCNGGFLCFNTYCVQEGAMRFSLTFNVDSDFDLHVKTPSGEEIFWDHREAGDGRLDVDQCVSGCGGSSHVENVFFTDAAAQGDYTFFVENYNSRSGGGDFTVEVAANGQKKQFTGTLAGDDKAESETFTYSYPPPPLPDAGTTADAGAADAGTD